MADPVPAAHTTSFVLGLIESSLSSHDVNKRHIARHLFRTAEVALAAQATEPLVAAAFVHDIAHLFGDADETPAEELDIQHAALAAEWLLRGWPLEVTAPVAMHVQAKRYWCAVAPEYQLDVRSAASLRHQGGPMSQAEVEAFVRRPFFESAIQLRRWDDAVVPGDYAPSFALVASLERILLSSWLPQG